ncbi:MAG: 2-amino-4-hydroxy-6-hydroxymethyldihydropteridine diphosphokinase [Lachnospiraceae bacterium]|jgi:dihydroneopterin aldolase/2-amino-4-hydroxy-6-hydroxymethyldihydropteridine diphosphokinase|nr:2-amino-4-hydroxy-6-hydroxymethyldihydropteridine diphosphokinase [Lachnospiraceae bacterium]
MDGDVFRDRIQIDGLRIFAHHGVYPEETEKGQHFVIDAVIETCFDRAASTDDLGDTVNYGTAAEFLASFLTEHTYSLLEKAAQEACLELLMRFPAADSCTLRIRKPEAPIRLEFESVSVSVKRSYHRVFLSAGANLGDREGTILKAVEELRADPHDRRTDCSELIETAPYGVTDQPAFLNCAVLLETLYSPAELLAQLHRLENEAGRRRERHWGPRTLDLDIVFYDSEIIGTPELAIPHPDFANREFVLGPVASLNPNFRDPLSGKTVAQLLAALQHRC